MGGIILLERLFKLSENGTDVRTEILAGLTTFMTMAYILIVNPLILSDAGMDRGAVMVATILGAVVGTLVMSLYANKPFALAPGMGLNAFFTYSVVLTMGLSWQGALAAVFMDGIIFLVLTLTGARKAIVDSIPTTLKLAVGAGIGLFIALIGFVNAGIVVPGEGTILMLGNIGSAPVLLAVIGLVLTAALVVLKVRGGLLIGIIVTTILGIPMGVTDVSNFAIFSAPPSIAPVFGAFWSGLSDLAQLGVAGVISIIFTFTFVDMFDTIGTLVGVSSKAGMMKEDGSIPGVERALMADSVGTIFGAIFGTSTVTTYVESASGVAEGGKTGLTSLTTAVLFLLCLFLSPLFLLVPGAATAPILIIVGVFMMEPVMRIDFSQYQEAIPAFLALVMMPFAYSIAEGIIWGLLAYVILRLVAGRTKELNLTLWILFVLFIIRFWFI